MYLKVFICQEKVFKAFIILITIEKDGDRYAHSREVLLILFTDIVILKKNSQ